MAIFKSKKFSLKLPEEQQIVLNNLQKECVPEDVLTGLIQCWLDRCPYDKVCTTMIYQEGLDHSTHGNRKELREIAYIMNHKIQGWVKYDTADSQVRISQLWKTKSMDTCRGKKEIST